LSPPPLPSGPSLFPYTTLFRSGRGLAFVPAADGTEVAVISLLGKLFLAPALSPFEIVEELVEQAAARTPVIVVDMHAEATSEKRSEEHTSNSSHRTISYAVFCL